MDEHPNLAEPDTPVLVSVTGLQLKAIWHRPRFAYHAMRSFAQARKSDGNLLTDARIVDGHHHTMTAWRDRKAMVTYVRSGAHKQAMRIFHRIATGSVVNFEAYTIPDWTDALAHWRAEARAVLSPEQMRARITAGKVHDTPQSNGA